MRIPHVQHAERFVGLFVFDFGTHVSVGYTAAEIAILKATEAHASGTALEIYRVTEAGGFELRGLTDERLHAREAICFLRAEALHARRDYAALHDAARNRPIACRAELALATVQSFKPPHATALIYPVAAAPAVSGWLADVGLDGGDTVIAGADVYRSFLADGEVQFPSEVLPSQLDYSDRSAEQVMRTVDLPVQR